MNRLWVRFSVLIGGVLFAVFFLQFLSIIIPHTAGWEEPRGEPPDAEIASRLLEFMALSALVGLASGIVIARVVSAPVSAIAQAARQIGSGNLAVTVPVCGSEELQDLARTFNKMADELHQGEIVRRNLMNDISHELRTPLAVLEGNLRIALDELTPLDGVAIAHLYSQTRHLTRLVTDLGELALAESHQLPLTRQWTDLSDLVTESLQALTPLADEAGVRLTSQLVSLPRLWIDPLRIRQVLFNLLTNALRHTPFGGSVTVVTSVDELWIRLEIRDTGEGLTPEQIDTIFERFYRTDSSRSRGTGGTGLGLAIVKAISEMHGGNVSASSEGKGHGTTCTVTLPINAPAQPIQLPAHQAQT